jgi:hypothetical protein
MKAHKYMTFQEVAELTHCSIDDVRRWAAEDLILPVSVITEDGITSPMSLSPFGLKRVMTRISEAGAVTDAATGQIIGHLRVKFADLVEVLKVLAVQEQPSGGWEAQASPKEQRAKWLEMLTAEQNARGRGALQRLADKLKIDRSALGKKIKLAKQEKDQAHESPAKARAPGPWGLWPDPKSKKA